MVFTGRLIAAPGIPADAWNAIFAAFTTQAGSTWGDYVTKLDNDASYLGQLGLNVADVSKLLPFQLMQADGICPIQTLASSVDASVLAPGLPLTFSRSYGERISQRYALGPLGRGWSHNWQYSLQVGSDGTVTIFGPGGSQRIFQPDERGGYFNQVGDYATITQFGGAYTLTEKSGLLYYYQPNGSLAYIQDLNNNRISLGYTGGLLTSLTHSSGQNIQFGYNAVGLIQTVSDQFGHQTVLAYDAANEHLVGAQYFDGRTATYTYNTTGPLTQLHALTGSATSCCNWRYFNYDSLGRLTGTALPDNAEALTLAYGTGAQVVVTDALGNPTQFFYNNNGFLEKTEDALGNLVQLSFDNNYNLVSVIDPAGRSYNYEYDSLGNLIQSTDPLGDISQFTYTSAHNCLASVTDAKGNTTQYDYDSYGNLTSITYADASAESWSYNSLGEAETWSNRRAHTTSYTYDTDGRITGKHFIDGSATLYLYDAQENLTNTTTYSTTFAPLESVNMTYDFGDRLAHLIYPSGQFLQFGYDSNNRRISSVDQLGHMLLYNYDAAGRLQSLTNELSDLVVQYQYDPAGRVVVKTLGNGMFTTYQNDSSGQLLSMSNFLGDCTIISIYNYTYDSRGRRTTMATLDGHWTYTYDDIGRLTQANYTALGTNVPNQSFVYKYDALGNRTSTVENGVTNAYAANGLNENLASGATTYVFDPDGNLVKESSLVGTNVYTYSDEDRILSLTTPQGTTTYSYDGLGNRLGVTNRGTGTRYMVDPAGLGNVVGEYDEFGNLIANYAYGNTLLSRTEASEDSAYYAFRRNWKCGPTHYKRRNRCEQLRLWSI